jgi:NAD(P)-dependent dehydrogenase (short-subunit alcohol dehydrogenase family)
MAGERQVAIITGAASGIGRAMTLGLLEAGIDVAAVDKEAPWLEELKATTGGKGFAGELQTIRADLADPASFDAIISTVLGASGRIDILVNNAGSSPGGVLEHLTEENWAQSLQLKFMGYVRCMKHVLPIMRQQKKGRVVNLIGNDGVKVSYWEIAPGAANAAGQNLTLSLASQYGKDNISFVAVNPGPVRTERWTGLVKAMARDMNLSFEEADKAAPSSIPLGRIAECEEVANLVTYLASDLAFFVNGTMIEIDGGQDKVLMDRLRDR